MQSQVLLPSSQQQHFVHHIKNNNCTTKSQVVHLHHQAAAAAEVLEIPTKNEQKANDLMVVAAVEEAAADNLLEDEQQQNEASRLLLDSGQSHHVVPFGTTTTLAKCQSVEGETDTRLTVAQVLLPPDDDARGRRKKAEDHAVVSCSSMTDDEEQQQEHETPVVGETEEDEAEATEEGGWGWMVVLGAFVVYWLVNGMIRSYGAVHLEILETFPESSETEAGWIPAFLSSISVGLAPISAVLGKMYTCRNVVFVGGLFCSLGLSLSFFAGSVFHLYLTLGLITGIGAGLCTTPSIIVVNSYFMKRRAMASGFCLSGAAVGSFTMPVLVKMLVGAYTFRGAMLVMGAIVLHVSACSLLYTTDGKWRIKTKTIKKIPAATSPKSPKIARRPIRAHEHMAQTVALLHKKRSAAIKWRLRDTWTPPPNNNNNNGGTGTMLSRSRSFTLQEQKQQMRHASTTSLGHSTNDISTASVYYDMVTRSSDDNHQASSGSHNNNVQADATRSIRERFARCGRRIRHFLSMCLDLTLFRELSFTVTVVTGVCIAGAFPHVLFFVPSFAKTLGIEKGDAGLLLSVSSAVDLVGRIAYGYFMDLRVIERYQGLAISCLVCALGTISIPFCDSFLPLATCTALFGFGAGTSFMLLPVILADNHGVDKLPSTYGLLRLFQGVMTLVMPPVVGLIKDSTGHYQPCFLLMGFLVFGATIAVLFMSFAQRHDVAKQTGCKL